MTNHKSYGVALLAIIVTVLGQETEVNGLLPLLSFDTIPELVPMMITLKTSHG